MFMDGLRMKLSAQFSSFSKMSSMTRRNRYRRERRTRNHKSHRRITSDNCKKPSQRLGLINGAKETRIPDHLHAMKANANLKCIAGEVITLITHSWLYQISTP